jgi:hypothetical protein
VAAQAGRALGEEEADLRRAQHDRDQNRRWLRRPRRDLGFVGEIVRVVALGVGARLVDGRRIAPQALDGAREELLPVGVGNGHKPAISDAGATGKNWLAAATPNSAVPADLA